MSENSALPATILLVDDTNANRYALRRMLESGGFKVLEAQTGAEALELAETYLPDLIVLDINLPDMTGYEVCRRLKEEIPATSSILVLHVSASYVKNEDHVRGLEGGADGYLVQPVDKPILLATVRSLLRVSQAERAYRESENRLRVALKAGRVVAWEWDATTNNVKWSGSFEKLSLEDGISLKAKNFLNHLHPKDRERVSDVIDKMTRDNPNYHTQYRVLNSDRQIFWLDERAEGKFNANGKLMMLSGVTVDITDRKLSEEALRQSEEWRRLASGGAGMGYWYFDVPSETIMVDEACIRMLGLHTNIMPTKAEVLRKIDQRDRFNIKKQLLRTFFGERLVTEFRVQLANGEVHWLAGYGNLLRVEHDRPYRITGVILDITPVKATQEALTEANALNRAIMANATTSICILDVNGLCTFMNPAAETMTGYVFQEMEGRPFYPQLQRNSHANKAFAKNNLFPSEECLHMICKCEDYFIHKDGTSFPVICNSSPILKDNSVVGVILEIRDVTQEKEAAEALVDSNRRKDEFLAMLAHELRNPLAPIRNALQILRLAGNDPNVLEKARSMMDRQLEQMVRLIDDLLDISRINRGTIELRKECIELQTIVANAKEALDPLIKASNHTFTCELPASAVYLYADPTRLTQVLTNVLHNAAKYTNAEGEIVLTAMTEKDSVTITITDNGIGIPTDMLPKIFDLFTQVDRSLERTHGGLGIGLTLVKKITEMHGGTIDVKSRGTGLGSQFILKLPALSNATAVQYLQAKKITDLSEAHNFRILIADDNEDAAESLAMMLNIMGNEARTAYDGLQALEMISSFRPDIVLLDIGMPKLNGYETAYLLREQFSRQEVALIALSGWGQGEDKRRSKQAGFDYHLVKPVSSEELSTVLNKIKQKNFDTV